MRAHNHCVETAYAVRASLVSGEKGLLAHWHRLKRQQISPRTQMTRTLTCSSHCQPPYSCLTNSPSCTVSRKLDGMLYSSKSSSSTVNLSLMSLPSSWRRASAYVVEVDRHCATRKQGFETCVGRLAIAGRFYRPQSHLQFAHTATAPTTLTSTSRSTMNSASSTSANSISRSSQSSSSKSESLPFASYVRQGCMGS